MPTAELIGDPSTLTYPALCPTCGAAADQWIRIEKVFMRDMGDGAQEFIAGVTVPFCHDCAARHGREVVAMSPLQRLVSELSSGLVIPMLCSGLSGLFFAKEALRELARPSVAAILGGVALVCLGIAYMCYRASVDRTASRRVVPQTSITRAFDFSDDRSELFDEQRRLYTITNPDFAAAFLAQNQTRTWNPANPKAVRAKGRRTVAVYVVLGVAVLVMVWNLIHG